MVSSFLSDLFSPRNSRNFHYGQFIGVGSFLNVLLLLLVVTFFGLPFFILARIPAVHRALSNFLKKNVSEGPTVAQRRAASVKVVTLARDSSGLVVGQSVVSCPSDPGYGSTARWITEAALCLVEARHVAGGVFTPATCKAMGHNLIERLKKANLRFEY